MTAPPTSSAADTALTTSFPNPHRNTVIVDLRVDLLFNDSSPANDVSKQQHHDNLHSVRHSNETAKAFLLSYPFGAYTALRTLSTTSVIDLQAHTDRLCESLRKIRFPAEEEAEADAAAALKWFRDPARAPTYLVPLARRALKEWLDEDATRTAGGVEAKITILVAHCQKKGVIVAAHCDQMFAPKHPTCSVVVAGSPRINATAKDSRWVSDRRELERHISPPINEVILSDRESNLYEGLTSNICVVINNEQKQQLYVACAPAEHILMGTVLLMVRALCEKAGIEFRREFPNVAHGAEMWVGAFLTSMFLVKRMQSTTRSVLPISEVSFTDGRAPIQFPAISPVIERIREGLGLEQHARASKLL
ncbi:hypothetical protein DFJ77DRAFT_442514 [Powellomyces hirtus]|nr:hypothetical protein DFJ77DRAFT_442514 [Powellomyces hirtus]